MPDAARVFASFRIRREGGLQELAAVGQLHRLLKGWALTCRMAGTDGPAGASPDSPPAEMMLILREEEIRLNRKGEVRQDQVFRVGEWKAGTIGTPYGTIRAEAFTRSIALDLLPSGGKVEWEYEWKTAGLDAERCGITLEIREELAK